MMNKMERNNFNPDKKLNSFKHYSLKLAEKEFDSAMESKVRVTTINWTFANSTKTDIDYDPEKPSPNKAEVHKNEYIFTLEELIEFIRRTEEVTEDVIGIEFISE